MNGWKGGCCSRMVVLVWLQSVPNIFICGNYQKTWNWGDCYWSGMYEWCYGLYSSQQHRRRCVGFGETYSNLFQTQRLDRWILKSFEIYWMQRKNMFLHVWNFTSTSMVHLMVQLLKKRIWRIQMFWWFGLSSTMTKRTWSSMVVNSQKT